MAGAGRKVFQPGEILRAADVNGFLMDQAVMVYADDAERTDVLGTAVSQGMVSFLQDVDQVQVYTDNWKQVYPRVPEIGEVLKVISATKTNTQSTSLTTGAAADISGLEISHAVQNSTNKVLLLAEIGALADSTNATIGSILFTANGTAIGVPATVGSRSSVSTGGQNASTANAAANKTLSSNFLYAPGSTSSVTYKVQIFNNIGTTQTHYINRTIGDSNTVGTVRTISTLTLMEVVA